MANSADQAKTKPCPICGESIKATARKCIHCGEYFDKNKDRLGLKGKTPWDFLGLLFVPLVLALLGYWFANFQMDLENAREDRLRVTSIAATETRRQENWVATATQQAANIAATSTREVEIAVAEETRWQQQIAIEIARQNFEWERAMRFEILSRKLDDGQQSLDEISDLINLRFFRLQQVYEAIDAGDLDSVNRLWPEYMEAVEMWNIKLITYQNRLSRLVSEDAKTKFNNYETDNTSIKNPYSIHGQFFVAHNLTLEALRCLRNSSCSNQEELNNMLETALRRLDLESDAFIDNTSALFLERASELEKFIAEPER